MFKEPKHVNRWDLATAAFGDAILGLLSVAADLSGAIGTSESTSALWRSAWDENGFNTCFLVFLTWMFVVDMS